jgi:hypothetical protein
MFPWMFSLVLRDKPRHRKALLDNCPLTNVDQSSPPHNASSPKLKISDMWRLQVADYLDFFWLCGQSQGVLGGLSIVAVSTSVKIAVFDLLFAGWRTARADKR